MVKRLKIYGERNSGTNYLEGLIRSNLDAEIIKFVPGKFELFLLKHIRYDFVQDLCYYFDRARSLGWKHGCPPFGEIDRYGFQSLRVVTITKNPYTFLLSLYRNPYHIKGERPSSFDEFLKQKWILRGRDLCQSRVLPSPMDLWNRKNRSYLKLKERSNGTVMNITYESLIEDPEATLQHLAKVCALDLKGRDGFVNISESTKGSTMGFSEYRNYYLGGKWQAELEDGDIVYINKSLDKGLMSYFNYDIIKPRTE